MEMIPNTEAVPFTVLSSSHQVDSDSHCKEALQTQRGFEPPTHSRDQPHSVAMNGGTIIETTTIRASESKGRKDDVAYSMCSESAAFCVSIYQAT